MLERIKSFLGSQPPSQLDLDELVRRSAAEPVSPARTIRYILGLDLGQAADYSALAVLRRKEFELPRPGEPLVLAPGRSPGIYDCIALKRWPLGTSYPDIVDGTCKVLERDELKGSDLVVDATGVGRPVVDMLRKAKPAGQVRPVMITAGASESVQGGYFHVAKTILISCTNVLLQSQRIKFAAGMFEVNTLVKELQNYRLKVTAAANETYNAREGAHDDLVLALALPCWFGERGQRRLNVWV